ncbi:hypothetical protein BHE74_00049415 [Ensete ventricosum]|nr:hypothetical protein GW17_00043044 [Ensete ventricosum]RWW44802.1 hypothetical protein BHE74_00049415 [Ensete ventricosum]
MCDEIISRRIVLHVHATFWQHRQRGGGAASPHAGPTTHGQAVAKAPARGRLTTARASLKGRPAALARGDTHPQGQQLAGAVPASRSAVCGGSTRPWARSVAASPQGRQPSAGKAACSAAPAKGASYRALARGSRQQWWPLLGRVVASGQWQPPPA